MDSRNAGVVQPDGISGGSAQVCGCASPGKVNPVSASVWSKEVKSQIVGADRVLFCSSVGRGRAACSLDVFGASVAGTRQCACRRPAGWIEISFDYGRRGKQVRSYLDLNRPSGFVSAIVDELVGSALEVSRQGLNLQ